MKKYIWLALLVSFFSLGLNIAQAREKNFWQINPPAKINDKTFVNPAWDSMDGAPASQLIVRAVALKVAFVYVGPVGDGGWTFQHEQARRKLMQAYPTNVMTTYITNVPESAEASKVFRKLVADGYELIFATTFGYMDSLHAVAKEFPQVKFEHATGYKAARNIGLYSSRTYEGAYLSGVIAGGMTKTNLIGVVGAIPIPEVIANINAYTMGARSVNPLITTRVAWVNSWYNPPLEAQATKNLINAGVDILLQTTDSNAVLQTAENMGVRAFGWDSDMTAYAPKAHLGSAIIDWSPYYIKTVRDMLAGNWASRNSWWGIKEGAIDMVSIADDVPDETKMRIDEIKTGLKAGTFNIWKGPITGQDGKEILAKDAVGDDKFLSGVNFYVKGVEGKIPGGDKK